MAIDYDALSKQELEALLAGNYDALSKETLQMIIDVEEQTKRPRLGREATESQVLFPGETTGVQPEKEEPSFLQNVLAGVESTGIRFGTRGAYAPPDETAQYFASAEAKEKARKAALIESGADPESFGYMGGELLATAPMAGPLIRGGAAVLEQVVPRAAPLAASIRSGGFKTTLPATAPTAARVGIQAAGGATAATVPTILTEPEQTTEAALTGAVLGPAAPVLAKAGARTFGKTVDLLSGKTPELRAARRARAMAGEKVNELRAALSTAPAGTTPSQVAADIDAPALQTLLQKAEELDPNQVARTVRRLQGEDLVRELERIAGGATATESRQTRELGKKALDEITGKMREQELRAAGAAARLKPKIESVAGRAREAASEAVQDVRRSESMINSALRWAKDWAPGGARQPGAPRGPTQYTYPGELAGRAEEFGKEAAEESLRQGAKARFAEAAAQRLEESGLKPLTAEKLFNSISAKLRNPDIATNPTAAKALNRLSDMLIDWSDEYGAITPEALYAIRKNGVTGIIDELMPGADENARRRLTQKVMTELKPLIDDAIEEAGGKDWRNYLKTFEQGMQTLSRRELGNEARLMFKENPKGFIALVRGENPEAVEEVFGPGSYDIVKEMAENMGVLRKGAEYLEKEARIEAQARAGQAAYDEIARRQEYKIRFPWLTRFTTGLNEQFRRWEGKIDNRTIDILVNAARSNADFKKLIETIPTQYRSAVLRNISNPEEWNEFSGLVTNAIATYQEENPEAELKFARGGPVRYSPQEEMLLSKYARGGPASNPTVPSEEPEGEEKGRVARFLEAAVQELPSAMLENVRGYSDLASKYLTWKFGGMPVEDQVAFARSLPSALREAAVNAIQSAKDLPEKIRTATPESAGEFTGRILAGELTDPMRVGRAARAVTKPVMSKIFIGKSAKNWDADAAKRAEEMEKEGYPAGIIWEKTGTFRSPDGELRQEISDLPSSWKGGESGSSLKDVLEHPELFKAYPDLKETMVKMKSTQEGTYYPPLEVAKRPERIEVGEPNSRSIALHEIQHAIQEREDFATGGKPYLLSESDDLLKSYNFFKEFGDKMEEFRNLKRMLPREQRPRVRATINWSYRDFDIEDMFDEIDEKVIDPEIKEKMLNIANELDVRREKVFGPETFGKPVGVEKFENYKKLAGEAEARAVQERANYSPSMLKETMPLLSYDVPLQQLVIKRKQDQ